MIYRTRICLLAVTMLALTAAGCHSDGLYDSCPLSNSIVEECAKIAGEGQVCDSDADCDDGLSCFDSTCTDGTAYTCVVAEHPFCLEEICASWKGRSSVCTRACVIDDDCPGVDTCVAHQDLSFCLENVTR